MAGPNRLQYSSHRIQRRVRKHQRRTRLDYERHSLRSQLRRHSVALISLTVALVSLGYNTWRNETSELHRNWRQAAFEVVIEVNDLQQITLYRRYFHGREDHPFVPVRHAETWVTGWGKAAAIRDLTSILPDPLPARGRALHETWSASVGQLDNVDRAARKAEQDMLEALDDTRQATLALIDRLR